MKTLRVSDSAHRKLTGLLGELTVQKRKMQTFTDVIENLLGQSVILPPELLAQVEKFIEENKNLGYTTKEEFFRDAARWRLRSLSDEYEYVEVRKDEYERLESAIKEMNLPFRGVSGFIGQQIKDALEKHAEWQEQREEHEKRQRKKG